MAEGGQADEGRNLFGAGVLRLKNMRRPGVMPELPTTWQELPASFMEPVGLHCRVYRQQEGRALIVMHSLDWVDGEWWDYVLIIGRTNSLSWDDFKLARELFIGVGRELSMVLGGPPYNGLHIWARKSKRKDGG